MWYKDAIIYELHVRSFFDKNGDGIGDFKGLTAKLDYLSELGVTALWLLPFYPSPLRDDGYDISDYKRIHPHYGTLADFDEFLAAAHSRKLKVITELIVNHTSIDHPWFQASRRAKPGEPYYDYYLWAKDDQQFKDARIIFKDYERSNWAFDDARQEYYWHRFFSHQPDLNFENESVQKEIFNVVDFWLNRGVDGLRLDAVPYLFEEEGTSCENLPQTHQFLKKLRSHVDENYENRLLLAEANQWPQEAAAYFGDGEGDECHMCFHFPLMPRLFMALSEGKRHHLDTAFAETPTIPAKAQWATFLRNHDELTLEMVTEEERIAMLATFAREPRSAINLGIRHRLAPLLGNDRRKIELLFTLLFSLPGTPVLYYGDEIGMGDNPFLSDRDGLRTPMQWNQGANAGFSTADAQRLYLPVITAQPYHYGACNVADARKDEHSLYHVVQGLIESRLKSAALSHGSFQILEVGNAAVFGFVRKHEHQAKLIAANLSDRPQSAQLEGYESVGKIELAAYACLTFDVSEKTQIKARALEHLSIASLTSADGRRVLEQHLPAFLQDKRWFAGRLRALREIKISDVIYDRACVAPEGVVALIIDAKFLEGASERYAVYIGLRDGALYDVFDDAAATNTFFDAAFSGRLSSQKNAQLSFLGEAPRTIASKLPALEQSNSSVFINDDYYLKAFRKIEEGLHPEVELSRHLASHRFTQTPQFVGALQYKGKGPSLSLALMTKRVATKEDSLTFVFKKDSVASLAELTGQMHLALSSSTDSDFLPETVTPFYLDSLRQSIIAQFDKALRALTLDNQKMSDAVQRQIEALRVQRPSFIDFVKQSLARTISSPRIRVHGDYHLGQIIVSGDGLSVVDFEGDPLRPLAERRLKRSCLYDVASMIRSFDYAAQLKGRNRDWAQEAERDFVYSYFKAFLGTPFLQDDANSAQNFLEALILEKNLREILYELSFRPDHLHIPLSGIIERLHRSQLSAGNP